MLPGQEISCNAALTPGTVIAAPPGKQSVKQGKGFLTNVLQSAFLRLEKLHHLSFAAPNNEQKRKTCITVNFFSLPHQNLTPLFKFLTKPFPSKLVE